MTLTTTRQNALRGPLPRTMFDTIFGLTPNHSVDAGVSITNRDDGYQVEIPVPGFAPDQIDVTVEENVLSVVAKNDRRQTSRLLVIPEDTDKEAIDVSVEHGMLTIILKTHPKAQPRKLTVRGG